MATDMPGFPPIPGETPIDNLSGLIPKAVTTRQQLNLLEAENIRKVVVRYLASRPTRRQVPFTVDWSLKLHHQMFGQVWRWAGQIRTVELNLGSPAHRTLHDLIVLFDDVQYWQAHRPFPLLEQAVRLHHRSVQIHPFLNGNGRWSRLLTNIYLRHHAHPIILWPDQTIGQESIIRQAYLSAIRSADAGNYTPLIDMHRHYLERPQARCQ